MYLRFVEDMQPAEASVTINTQSVINSDHQCIY
jgi:flagellar biosynthesis/type III secretory pathway M-ring protein FliF/YscJ